MRFSKVLLMAASVALVAGCTTTTHNYAKKAEVSAPLAMPANVGLRSEQTYYPIPSKPNLSAKQPSLVPPGSHLSRYDKKKPVKVAAVKPKQQLVSVAKWSQTNKGQPMLVLSEKNSQAWAQIGKALRATNYQILDQDPSMSSYYILDTKTTNKQITEKTPIYRVYVKKSDNNLSNVVLMSETNKLVSADIAKRVLGALEQHLV